jgi:DNA replication protein DnaC
MAFLSQLDIERAGQLARLGQSRCDGNRMSRSFAVIADEIARRRQPIDDEEVAKELRKLEDKRLLAHCNDLWERSGCAPMKKYARASMNGIDARLPDKFRQLASAMVTLLDEPGQMIIDGPYGRGKTWLAVALVRECCRRAMPAKWKRADELAEQVRARELDGDADRKVFQPAAAPRLMIIDELTGRLVIEKRGAAVIERIVKLRDERDVSTVILTNLSDQPEGIADEVSIWSVVGGAVQRVVQESAGLWTTSWPRIKTLL